MASKDAKHVTSGMATRTKNQDRQPSENARRLKAMRERWGITMPEAAEAAGYSSVSSYQHLEDIFKKRYLPLDRVQGLAKLFVERGADIYEVFALAGTVPTEADLSSLPTGGLKKEETAEGKDGSASTVGDWMSDGFLRHLREILIGMDKTQRYDVLDAALAIKERGAAKDRFTKG